MRRVALKLGYIGTGYHGFQVQPDLLTVEGAIIEGLKSSGLISDRRRSRYAASARTDRGVHACGHVIAFDTEDYNLTLPRIINTHLPRDIWVWARSEVDPSFDPRRDALYREYRYILYGDSLDLERMKEASRLLIGRHDFANFSKRGEEFSTIRKVHKLDITRSTGNLIIFDIRADAFLRQMVRRIVGALVMIGSGERDIGWLEGLLNGEPASIKPAPPEGLILTDVAYDRISFEVDHYVLTEMRNHLSQLFRRYVVLSAVMDELGKC
ncbi:MAG TPA: tRNA pseudouridine(38-40) synthase TruA [Candidatus Syntrophoarchaeum butanivorans]|uniref:tRNA pseudouridine synthase A n=1 Tax=Candidatus Syntropharchaeum butanivorans TaxID=1839936 RepID=A0A7C1B890_9EURY|nr:tRNA pseudouridine(38-40) synthase TruA [Candidatus Syntrophoarchaeum butanivorans]